MVGISEEKLDVVALADSLAPNDESDRGRDVREEAPLFGHPLPKYLRDDQVID